LICLGLFGYYSWKYAFIPSKFDYNHYSQWVLKYEEKHPYAEKEAGRKRLEETQGAPVDFPLEKKYLKSVVRGKKCIIIFSVVGGILTTIGSIL